MVASQALRAGRFYPLVRLKPLIVRYKGLTPYPRRNPGENADPATFRPFHPPGTPRPPGPSPTGQGPSL